MYGFYIDLIVFICCFVFFYGEIKGIFNKNKDNRKINEGYNMLLFLLYGFLFIF